ncbi:MAG: DEAD/DEAH box helicase [Myxococcales bacterium]|nr:DEAD/DEAH box helicase [Myxococcales bacterium]MCB9707977.1 DEAD/DEAH box helicase [Myxococcales bacterium]
MISDQVGRLSDRAIQRQVGGNAFLRGRLYARRGGVSDLGSEGRRASCEIKTKDQPVQVGVELNEQNQLVSNCTCTAWRGPTGHCKHVAALLVALRDQVRPPRPKPDVAEEVQEAPGVRNSAGKRRRSRRRRRPGASGDASTLGGGQLEVLTPTQLGFGRTSSHGSSGGGLDTWLPDDAYPKSCQFEYRMTVRPAAISVTPVLAGTRSAVPITEALNTMNAVSSSDRPLFRLLARHASRNAPATAELRAEDAAEAISGLKGRRVLLEPASMEMRFTDEALLPKIELEQNAGQTVRVRVAFELKNGSTRRFALSSGAWFEGTPGWYIDTTEGVARPVAENVTPAWLQRLYRSPAIVQPMSELPRLLVDFIPRVAASLGTQLPDLSSVADLIDAQPRFQLRANGDLLQAELRLRVLYDDLAFDVPVNGFPSPLAIQHSGQRPRVLRRDVGSEMTAVQKLMDLGAQVNEAGDALVMEGDAAVSFWTEGLATLPDAWERFVPSDLSDVTVRESPVTPQMRVSSGVDWLGLDMTFSADGVAVSADELRACLEHGRRLVKLADGTYAPVTSEEVGPVLERMAEILATSGSQGKLPLSQAGRVQDLLRIISDQKITPTVKTLFGKLADAGQIEPVAKPRSLKATLRPYQKEGFSWLVFLHNLNTGGILADDMGLGKTLEAIALLLWLKSQNKDALSVVVAPTSVVPNWEREINKFAPTLKVAVWHGPDRQKMAADVGKADVMITSYALLRRDEEFLQTLELDYAILDEAQHIKNPLSATARAAKRLKSKRRLAMTGTPIENRLSEIWSIFDFVSPGLLGDLKTFEEKFSRPIERGDADTAARLRATIHPFVMRRTKQEVAKDLPEKIEQEIIVPLADEQSKLYQQILAEVRKSVLSEIDKQGVNKAQIQILAALTRLRQVACDPRLLKLTGTWEEEESGKLGALREIVSNALEGGHRVLVFSQFVEMLKLIREMLDSREIVYEYLDGSTKDRQERVDRFNTDESCPVFLVSLKAGGTGLNLTGADTVVHFDPWWNPAVEDQATDRAHRIGQTKIVNVYRLIARDTVEEKILQLSAKKRELVSNVLVSEGGPMKGLTRDDVVELFS